MASTIDHLRIPDLILKLYILFRVISHVVVKKVILFMQEQWKGHVIGVYFYYIL
jgi:hypothetical protein